MFVQAVYLLCAATSIVCALLLLRGYRISKARLLLWSGLCFGFLAVENVLLIVDYVVFPEIALTTINELRRYIALCGLSLLIFGLVFDLK